MTGERYFLWGAGTFGGRLIDFMKNDIEFRAVIDNNPEKQGTSFHGIPVIGYENAKKQIPECKTVIAMVNPRAIKKLLISEGYVENRDFYVINDFIPRYYREKGKITSMCVTLPASNSCNLKCEGCLAYIPYGKGKIEQIDYRDMTGDIDLLFSHVDVINHFNFNCGESLLNKKLADVCLYAKENYAGRYNVMAVQTNGTIVPGDDIMRRFAEAGVELSVSKYPENAATRERLVEKCNEFGIPFYYNIKSTRENWSDFGDPRLITETNPERLRKRYNECLKSAPAVYRGFLYLCLLQAWSHVVPEAGTMKPGDVFDLRMPRTEASNEELYKLLSRQPDRGYVSHCMRCNGTTYGGGND